MMYPVLAAVLLIVFYGIYYGKLFLQKKQGIRTNQLGKQKQGTVAKLMSLATMLVPVGEVIALFLGGQALPVWARNLGVLLAAGGDLLFFISVTTMGSSWRAGVNRTEKTELITGGIYSFSRNPAFLSFDLVYVGILLMFFSWWLLLLTLFAVVMLHLQIVMVEEPSLPEIFGEDYVRYSRRVCRYLGRKAK